MGENDQLDLFGSLPAAGSVTGSFAERLAREHAECAEIASRLPPNVFFGTSSWSFPGWAGIVYPRRASEAQLAREGLRDYARHPLLRTVGIDRGFYAPIPERDLARYAEQLPAGFRCCAKAPAAVTSAELPRRLERQPGFPGSAEVPRGGPRALSSGLRGAHRALHPAVSALLALPAAASGRLRREAGALPRRAAAGLPLRRRAARPVAPDGELSPRPRLHRRRSRL